MLENYNFYLAQKSLANFLYFFSSIKLVKSMHFSSASDPYDFDSDAR